MSEQLRSEPPAPSRRLADRADPEAFVHTVGLEELLSTLRRHVWLVLGVAAVAVAATGFVAYTTGPVYRAVAVIRLSDPRRALTGGVVEDINLLRARIRADDAFRDIDRAFDLPEIRVKEPA